jgi:hypothetical protein
MEDVCGLILLEKVFDTLTIPQIALNELHVFQLGNRIGVQPVSANNVPTFTCQKLDHMRADESLRTSHQSSFLH